MWNEDTAFVSQGLGRALPSSTTAECFIYWYNILFVLFIYSIIYLLRALGPCPVVLNISLLCSHLWHSHVEAFLFPTGIWVFRARWRIWSFWHCPAPRSAAPTAGAGPSQSLFRYKPQKINKAGPPVSPPCSRPSQCRENRVIPSHSQAGTARWGCLTRLFWQPAFPAAGPWAGRFLGQKHLVLFEHSGSWWHPQAEWNIHWSAWQITSPALETDYSVADLTSLSSLLETFSCSCQTTSTSESAVLFLAINPCFTWRSAFKQMMSCCLILRKGWGFKNKTKILLKSSILEVGLTEDTIPFEITGSEKSRNGTVKTFAFFLLSVEVV